MLEQLKAMLAEVSFTRDLSLADKTGVYLSEARSGKGSGSQEMTNN